MFSGSIPALATPFKSNFEIDFEAYGRFIDWQLEQGSNGVVSCGCSGEAATMTHDEQKQLNQFAVERVAGRATVICGTGSNNTLEAIDLATHAKEIGADGGLSITPYYNKPTAAGQIEHYTRIAEAADGLPIMLYNVPGRTGTKIAPETIAALSRVPNIVSVKEACGSLDQVSDIRARCDINIMSGDDSLTVPMMAIGASGVVSVTANVAPGLSADMVAKAAAGDFAGASELHYKLLPLFRGLFLETNPMPVKAMLAKMGLMENTLRLPLTPVLEATSKKLDAIMTEVGIERVA